MREHYESFAVAEDAAPSPVEIAGESDSRTIVGYAVVWGAISSVRADGFRHFYERGSIQWAPVVNVLWHHGLATPLASTRNGTARIVEDDIGAKLIADLDETTDGQNALIRVRSRLVTGMSFGVSRDPAAVEPTGEPRVIRVTRAICDEVTLTIDPAMTATAIVPASESENLLRAMKERKAREQKNKLTQSRLAMLRR